MRRMCADPQRIRIVLAEDNGDLLKAICALCEAEPDLEVVGTVDAPEALLGIVRDRGAQVVVLDLNLGERSSVPAMQCVRRELPHVAVVVYSGYERRDVAAALPALGAAEFVSKTGDVSELFDAVRRVAASAAAGAGP